MHFDAKCCVCGEDAGYDVPDQEANALKERGINLKLSNITCDACFDAKERRKEQEAQERAFCLALEKSKIPTEMTKWDERLGNKHLLAWIIANAERSLYIAGAYGQGKTRACATVGAKLVAKGLNVRYWLVGDLLSKFSTLYGENFGQDENLVSILKGCRLLILDDIGKEKITDRSGEAIFRIINARYENKLPTWITANLNGSELSMKMGDRGGAIIRRLRDTYVAWNGGQVAATSD